MNQDKYVFSQLSTFLNKTQFNNYVCKCAGNCYVKHFICWTSYLQGFSINSSILQGFMI